MTRTCTSDEARIDRAAVEVTTRYVEYLRDYGFLDKLTDAELTEKIVGNLRECNLLRTK